VSVVEVPPAAAPPEPSFAAPSSPEQATRTEEHRKSTRGR
jgi:hypothetical protein